MGFLESIKRTLNIAGAEVAVITDDDVYSQGDRVSGKVRVTAGEYEQSGRAITIELREYWTESRYNSATRSSTTVTVNRTRETVTLAEEFSLAKHEERSFPFEVALPFNGRISRSGSGWKLAVRLDIPMAVDPSGAVRLDVRPGEELLAVVDACEIGLRFEEIERHRRWSSGTSDTYFRLQPPKVLTEELDYMALQIRQREGGGVEGELVFDLQEKSIGDYFKCVLNLDKERRELVLTADQVLAKDGSPNEAEIKRVIGDLVRSVIEDRK